MEALRTDTVHTPDVMCSLSRISTHHIDEISKEKEDELLYGAGDDGDEEDTLSDDSMRLRLSDDDEIETEDVLPPAPENEQTDSKHEDKVTSGESGGAQASTVPKSNVTENDTAAGEVNEEEHCSGNVSMDDTIVHDRERDTKRNDYGTCRQLSGNMPRYPWLNFDCQWRFPNGPRYRPYRSMNHLPYTTEPYLIPRGHYRPRLYNYNHRFHGAFLPFERGRGGGKFNSYNSPMYDNRQQNKPCTPAATRKLCEPDQHFVSLSTTNISSETASDSSVKEIDVDTSENVNKSDAPDSSCSTSDVKNDSNVNAEDTPTEDFGEGSLTNDACIDDSLEPQEKLKSVEENSETISLSNDADCEDSTTIENNNFNEDASEKLETPSMNPNDVKEETDKDTTDANDVKYDSNVPQSPKDRKILEKLLTEEAPRKSDKSKAAECIEKDDESSEKQNETVATDMDTTESKQVVENQKSEDELSATKQTAQVNQRIEVAEDNCEVVSDNLTEEKITSDEVVVDEELTDQNVEQTSGNKEEGVTVQNTKSNEDNEDNVLKGDDVNELRNSEHDKEINVIENDALLESVANSEKCDNDQLNDSDNSTNSTKLIKVIAPEAQLATPKIDLQEQDNDPITENVESTESDCLVVNSDNKASESTENVGSALDESNLSSGKSQIDLLGLVTDVKGNKGDNDKNVVEVTVATQRRRRRTKKMIAAAQEAACEEDKQVRDSGRQKRRTAKNAEEIIRKKFLNHDSDLESSDGSEKFVIVNHKMNQDARSLSPPSLKRNCPDTDSVNMNGSVKKVKVNSETLSDDLATKKNNAENIKKLDYVRKFFQRDLKEKLPRLKQEELEELLIQKIVETITMRGEIGKLREQARISERNQEVTRAKCQQLAKQIKDFEMVLIRNAADRRANNDKPTPPIKINRSVGLQVNFITDHGMQNLRQLQQNTSMKSLQVSNGSNSNSPNISTTEVNIASSPRRGIKVRSPRRVESVGGQIAVVPQNHTQSPTIMPNITPAALVVAKPMDAQHTVTLPNQSNIQQIMSNPQAQPQQAPQAIVLNGKFSNKMNLQANTANVAKSRANDLIDLTDEEEKSKAAVSVPVVTTTVTDQQINLAQKTTQPCFQRVIQAIPGGNVAITTQPPSIRVVQPASQPTPTALVNNMNAPRLAYVMQSGVGPTRQLLIAPNTNQMRPVTSCTRPSFSTLAYKTGISTVANGTVRVLTTSATSNVQFNKHPAPLPDTRNYAVNPLWKLPPPAPSLKISKVANGIVLSWNMILSEKHADIASYQLYAYQEVAGIPPSTLLWKKVGDVRALPLPMACTLTQFSEGNNYYFAVRAVDTHSRKGQYSTPGNISL
ncbi:fibronectin-III type domain-containing protein windei isoform X3 [Andrena cerasifolii]|uniref:fibronectin-III type domain-containing protein windei isoform X3 n=1 Tax=Andrena cerasifolii TaxID=2819439 RepID=UPI00403781EE